MKNKEIAEILLYFAELLAVEGVQFKPRAYEKVAEAIEAFG